MNQNKARRPEPPDIESQSKVSGSGKDFLEAAALKDNFRHQERANEVTTEITDPIAAYVRGYEEREMELLETMYAHAGAVWVELYDMQTMKRSFMVNIPERTWHLLPKAAYMLGVAHADLAHTICTNIKREECLF